MDNDCPFVAFLAHDLAAAAVQVANDITHMCFGQWSRRLS